MHWYGGSIAEAVTLSKQKNAIFVVFVEGENDLSAEMSATIDDSAVVKRLSDQTNFLAIKLKSGTTNYTHFAQIYQFVPVPSLFFIGRNGTPLEVVCAGVQPSNLATRIDRILEEHHNEKQPSMQPSTSAQNVREQTSSLLQAEAAASAAPEPKPAPEEQPETSSGPAAKIQKTEHHEVTKSGQEYDVVCDGDVCVRRPRAAGAEPGPSQRPEPVSAATEHHEVTKSGQEYDVVCDGDVCVRRPRAAGAEPGPSQRPEPVSAATEHHEVTKSGQEYDVVCDGDVCVRRPRAAGAEPGPSQRPEPVSAANHTSLLRRPKRPLQFLAQLKCSSSKYVQVERQKTEHHEVTKSGQEYDVVCDGDVCVRRPRAAGAEPGPSQRPEPVSAASQMETEPSAEDSTASMEEKLERAKELIEARRREKAQKEKELEKQKELERRSQGQGMTELKNWQAEQELRQIQEERKREKFENNLARQRILEQIAQDRAERRARDQAPRAPPAPPAQSGATSGDGSGRARVQFKLPDGRSHTAHFAADDTLATLQQHIADNLQMSASNFSLWTAFPRRELSDPSATLRQLELAPSAALLVLPRRAPTQVAAPSPVASIVAIFTQFITSFILAPSQQLFNWIRARLFAPPPPTTPSQPPRASPPPGLRRRGNIHRLPGDRAADDDNNTWNGNSTQQM
ncbi:UBX domain-containing protein 4-like [Ostrinia nubilalis]|uniref:UBX domain-containing protein 4-like n=1 Tax=Ostrinia nubilalis TaxID=29057 RepID=UPI0030823ACF